MTNRRVLSFLSGRRHRRFETGGMWEGREWAIVYNERIRVYRWTILCNHCGPISGGYAVCPRTIVTFSDGGYITSGVCLDCVLERVDETV